MNLLIFGSRDFHYREFLYAGSYDFLYDLGLDCRVDSSAISVITGMARGADLLGYDFSVEYLQSVPQTFHPDWEKYGKSAGFIRNKQMVDVADAAIGFSVNESKGTANTEQLCKDKGIPLRMWRFTLEKDDYNVNSNNTDRE